LWGATRNWTTSHETSQSLYYQWRDQFLGNAAETCESQQQGRQEARLERENARLKMLVGELLLELKKGDELLG
jgi:transposase